MLDEESTGMQRQGHRPCCPHLSRALVTQHYNPPEG